MIRLLQETGLVEGTLSFEGIHSTWLQIPDATLTPDHDRQLAVAVIFAVAIVGVVVELVRRRKLREEYSFLWLMAAAALLVMAIMPSAIVTLSEWIGAGYTTSTLFFFALVFLLLLCLQFSVRLSRLTTRSKLLVQRLALLEEELDRVRQEGQSGGSRTPTGRELPPAASGETARRPSRVSDR